MIARAEGQAGLEAEGDIPRLRLRFLPYGAEVKTSHSGGFKGLARLPVGVVEVGYREKPAPARVRRQPTASESPPERMRPGMETPPSKPRARAAAPAEMPASWA